MAMKTSVTLKSQNSTNISTIHFNIEQYFKEKNFIEKIVKKFTESQ